MSPQILIWKAAGSPAHPYKEDPHDGACATCATKINRGVRLDLIETPTMSNHADYFRFGSHVCHACAWLYAAGKGRPGNFLATSQRLEYTVISHDSVVKDKRPWADVLVDASRMPPDTKVTGVMTTDVKPRLWPRVRLATIGRFGLYLHAPEYDVSEWRQFDLQQCCRLIRLMTKPLALGYSKTSILHGLLLDYQRASKDMAYAIALDKELAKHRGQPYFLPALIAAGIRKETKHGRDTADTESCTAGSNQADQAQLGLL